MIISNNNYKKQSLWSSRNGIPLPGHAQIWKPPFTHQLYPRMAMVRWMLQSCRRPLVDLGGCLVG